MTSTTKRPTQAMMRVLKEMQRGGKLTRRDYVSGYMLHTSCGFKSLAYPMPSKMEDGGLIFFTRDNEEERFSRSTASLTDKARKLLADNATQERQP